MGMVCGGEETTIFVTTCVCIEGVFDFGQDIWENIYDGLERDKARGGETGSKDCGCRVGKRETRLQCT
jgi:hypothetical protein